MKAAHYRSGTDHDIITSKKRDRTIAHKTSIAPYRTSRLQAEINQMKGQRKKPSFNSGKSEASVSYQSS